MSELKPCPFCGNKEIECSIQRFFNDMTLLTVCCSKCGARVLRGESFPGEVINAWNRRADEKVGKWAEDVDGAYICSACGCYDYEASKYCPNCGAKMEAVNDGK